MVPGNPTLLEGLQADGGGINALARHAVAALLNASNPDVDSDFTVAQVIALVHDAIASGDLDTIKATTPRSSERARVPVELTPYHSMSSMRGGASAPPLCVRSQIRRS